MRIGHTAAVSVVETSTKTFLNKVRAWFVDVTLIGFVPPSGFQGIVIVNVIVHQTGYTEVFEGFLLVGYEAFLRLPLYC